jgi:hypothetical protein
MSMALEAHELEQIGDYVKNHLNLWLAELNPNQGITPHVSELGERIIRVEEELKSQRGLMKQWFEQVDKRFEQVDKRFEQVDKRFEQVDKRFEQMNERFGLVYGGLEGLTKRVDSLSTRMFQFMLWSFGFTATAAGIVISVIKFL